MYKKSIVEIVALILYFNLLAFAAFSLYHFQTDPIKQTAVAYTSTIITFLLLLGVIAYHVYLLIRKEKPTAVEPNEYPLTPVQPAKAAAGGVTFSVVEVRQPECGPADPDSDKSGEEKQGGDCHVTPR